MKTTTCTVTVGARGERCGLPAVRTFKGTGGEEFGECARHAVGGTPKVTEAGYATTVEFEAFGKTFRTATLRPFVIVGLPVHGEPFLIGYAETAKTAKERVKREARRAFFAKVVEVAVR